MYLGVTRRFCNVCVEGLASGAAGPLMSDKPVDGRCRQRLSTAHSIQVHRQRHQSNKRGSEAEQQRSDQGPGNRCALSRRCKSDLIFRGDTRQGASEQAELVCAISMEVYVAVEVQCGGSRCQDVKVSRARMVVLLICHERDLGSLVLLCEECQMRVWYPSYGRAAIA